jgi:hypothetical protein
MDEQSNAVLLAVAVFVGIVAIVMFSGPRQHRRR